MSTTVSYKGNTLTTVANTTKELLTSGTWLEDDITLTDVSTVPSGTKSISVTSNGTTTEDVTNYASASITANVPNSYSASDEGKVVSSGALVSQTAHADVTPTTSDQTIDTTTNNSLKVKGDANLVAGNIKKDVEIFGTTGSYEGGGGGGVSVDDFILKNGITSLSTDLASGTLRDYLFYGSTSLQSIEMLDYAGSIPSNSFRSCTALTSVKLPKVTSTGGNAFQGCTALTALALPGITGGMGTDTIRGCTSLTAVDLNAPTTLGANFFNGNTVMTTLVLRKSSVVGLANINAFSSTPFASGGSGGTIYVPNSLIDTYKSLSNWSTLNGYGTVTWSKIEDSYYETHYADGTVIS